MSPSNTDACNNRKYVFKKALVCYILLNIANQQYFINVLSQMILLSCIQCSTKWTNDEIFPWIPGVGCVLPGVRGQRWGQGWLTALSVSLPAGNMSGGDWSPSIWQSSRASAWWCFLCSLIEQLNTTGLTQTVMKIGLFIPKDQKGGRKDRVRPSACFTLVHLFPRVNSTHARPFKLTKL